MLSLESYLEMFPPATQEKPRFMALAGALLTQTAELLALVQTGIPAAYDLETASGAQLNALGELLNVPRPMPSTSDENYRFLLRARIAVHHWDGTNESLPDVLEAAFPGRNPKLIDNQDGTVTASVSGTMPFSLEELFPVPAGIRLVHGS